MPVITFAHRGGMAHAPENTIAAFTKGLELGASGLESDVWVAADGQPVLVHDQVFRRCLRRFDVGRLSARQLALLSVPRLADLFETLGNDFELSLDLKDPNSAGPTVEVVRRLGVPERTWLCVGSVGFLTQLRAEYPDVRAVHSRRREKISGSIERHAAELAELGIDAMNMHYTDWTAGLVALFHRFAIRAFSWDLQHVRHLRNALAMGVDAVYSDRVDRMVATVSEWHT
jgi:glycerophosphoryl diester phosphodiesterase